MGIISQIFGKTRGNEAARQNGRGRTGSMLNVAVLFSNPISMDTASATNTLRAYHSSLLTAVFELKALGPKQGPVGLARFGEHAIGLMTINAPIPPSVTDQCVKIAHYDPKFKEMGLAHRAHAVLFYEGKSADPYEQYIALATVAGSLASHGAVTVINEHALTSLPAAAIAANAGHGDSLKNLHDLPLLALYCGFVKYIVPENKCIWMRTHGCDKLGLPDLAFLAQRQDQGTPTFQMFNRILDYLRTSNRKLLPAQVMKLGKNQSARVRLPNAEESFLVSEGQLLIVEMVESTQG